MQETAELKHQHERERAEFQSCCQQQVDRHQEKANELDKQVPNFLHVCVCSDEFQHAHLLLIM